VALAPLALPWDVIAILRGSICTNILKLVSEKEESDHRWNTHRRAGLAVTTVQQFVRAIMDDQREKARGESKDTYSPLIKIYKVEK